MNATLEPPPPPVIASIMAPGQPPFSALSVLARCEFDDVLVATFPDNEDGLAEATKRAKAVVGRNESPPRDWQVQSESVLMATIVRGTPGGTTPLLNVECRNNTITVKPHDGTE